MKVQELLRLLAVMTALNPVFGPGMSRVMAQARPDVADLFRRMQSSKTNDGAARQLLVLGYSDPKARRYLAAHLPLVIAEGPKYFPGQSDPKPEWFDEVRLAGELRMVETAPALAKWISVRTGDGISTLSSAASLEDNPAGTALIQIGDPAIPALQGLLQQGNQTERWEAFYALRRIGSPRARAAFREYAAHGWDKSLAESINKATSR
jgi:hypothetical protein